MGKGTNQYKHEEALGGGGVQCESATPHINTRRCQVAMSLGRQQWLSNNGLTASSSDRNSQDVTAK
jgi:hypothetical protein